VRYKASVACGVWQRREENWICAYSSGRSYRHENFFVGSVDFLHPDEMTVDEHDGFIDSKIHQLLSHGNRTFLDGGIVQNKDPY
jgi:hypothetical protein